MVETGPSRADVGRSGVRVRLDGSGTANVATGLPVLDHLLTLTARTARFDLSLEVEPGSADAEVAAAGLASDIVATFLGELAEGAGLTLHVRLIEGSDPEHVLEAIFKALGAALGQAARPAYRKE